MLTKTAEAEKGIKVVADKAWVKPGKERFAKKFYADRGVNQEVVHFSIHIMAYCLLVKTL